MDLDGSNRRNLFIETVDYNVEKAALWNDVIPLLYTGKEPSDILPLIYE